MVALLSRHPPLLTAVPPGAAACWVPRWQRTVSCVHTLHITARRAVPAPGAAAAEDAQPAATCSKADDAATPLLQAVLERGGRADEVPFHVPGHKRGASTPPGLDQMLGGALRYDLTELGGELWSWRTVQGRAGQLLLHCFPIIPVPTSQKIFAALRRHEPSLVPALHAVRPLALLPPLQGWTCSARPAGRSRQRSVPRPPPGAPTPPGSWSTAQRRASTPQCWPPAARGRPCWWPATRTCQPSTQWCWRGAPLSGCSPTWTQRWGWRTR